jgi:ribbon-helix-helix protein
MVAHISHGSDEQISGVNEQDPGPGKRLFGTPGQSTVAKTPSCSTGGPFAGEEAVKLEGEFWNSLKEIARERNMTLQELVGANRCRFGNMPIYRQPFAFSCLASS